MIKPGTLQLVFIFLLVTLVLRQGLLALLAGLIFLALLVAQQWSRFALRRVTYERVLIPDHAFAGDVVTLQITIRNPKLLALPGLRIRDRVSKQLSITGVQLLPHSQAGMQLMERWTTLRPYEALTWHLPVQCQTRGFYPFGPVQVEASDPWGLYTTEAELPGDTALIVYPNLLPLPDLALDPLYPLGELATAKQLLTDPARTVGIRDYMQGDPFKAIHWGATARRGHLQTRLYEPTSSLEVAIMLDIDTFEQYWQGIEPETVEWMVSAAATIANAAATARWSFGLYANCSTAGGDQFIRIPPSRSPAQLQLVMDTLAKVVPFSIAPMASILHRISSSLPWGASLIIIGAVPSDAMQQSLLRLAERGRHILWLYCGPGQPPIVPGVDVRQVAIGFSPTPSPQSQRPARRHQVMLASMHD